MGKKRKPPGRAERGPAVERPAWARRLTDARKRLTGRRGGPLSLAELAERIPGMSGSRIGNYEQGTREPRIEDWQQLEAALGVSAAVLQFGEDAVVGALHNIRRTGPYRTLAPLVRTVPPQEGGATTMEDFSVPAWIMAAAGIDADSARIYFAPDDSMAHGIRKGWAVIVDTADTAMRAGDVFVIDLAGLPVLRRVTALPNGGIRLSCDNASHPAYAPVDVPSWSGVKVHGRVRWTGGA